MLQIPRDVGCNSIDWWIDWLTDWFIDFLIYWLIASLIDWFIYLFTYTFFWLIDWLADWTIEIYFTYQCSQIDRSARPFLLRMSGIPSRGPHTMRNSPSCRGTPNLQHTWHDICIMIDKDKNKFISHIVEGCINIIIIIQNTIQHYKNIKYICKCKRGLGNSCYRLGQLAAETIKIPLINTI